MAIVYLARQKDLDRMVALKELAGLGHAVDPAAGERFLRESRLSGSLSHANIVTVHSYFVHEGTPYMAMEYLPRGSLRPYVGSLSIRQAVTLLEEILSGLGHAHRRGIVHRDLKPENIMLTEDGRAKIADFGIAKVTTEQAGGTLLTMAGMTVGTPAYMAPEQAQAGQVEPATDLYSLGCIAFELLTGRLPFPGDAAPMVMLMRQINDAPPTVLSLDPSIAGELSDWVGRLLEKDPRARPASAVAAHEELEDIAIGLYGPRWRLRLDSTELTTEEHGRAPRPGTDAPAAPDGDDGYVSFAGGAAAQTPPGPATPPPTSPPDPELRMTVGPPTPPPVEAAPPSERPSRRTSPRSRPSPTTGSSPTARRRPRRRPSHRRTRSGPRSPSPSRRRSSSPSPSDSPSRRSRSTWAMGSSPTARDPNPSPRSSSRNRNRSLSPRRRRSSHPSRSQSPSRRRRSRPSPSRRRPPCRRQLPRDMTLPPTQSAEPETPVAPPPSRPPVPDEPGPRRWPLFAAIAAAVVVIGVVAVLLTGGGGGGGGGDDSEEPTTGNDVALPLGKVSAPSAWTSTAIPALEGLKMTSPVALAPNGDADAGVMLAGRSEVEGPSLLPAAFAESVGLEVDKPGENTTTLGEGDVGAYSYADLTIDGVAGPATLFVVPAKTGALTIACLPGSASAGAFMSECSRVASTLSVPSGEIRPLGADEAYGETLSGTLGTLDDASRSLGARLSDATTRGGQSKVARSISGAFTDASAALKDAETTDADQRLNAALGDALDAEADAFRSLSAAAGRGDEAGYSSARRSIPTRQERVDSVVAALGAAGYEGKVRAIAVPALRSPPKPKEPETQTQTQTRRRPRRTSRRRAVEAAAVAATPAAEAAVAEAAVAAEEAAAERAPSRIHPADRGRDGRSCDVGLRRGSMRFSAAAVVASVLAVRRCGVRTRTGRASPAHRDDPVRRGPRDHRRSGREHLVHRRQRRRVLRTAGADRRVHRPHRQRDLPAADVPDADGRQRAREHRRGPGRGVVVHGAQRRQDRPDHHRRRDHGVPAARARQPAAGDHARPGWRALGHALRDEPGRARHDVRAGHAVQPRACPPERSSSASRWARTARCGSPSRAPTASSALRRTAARGASPSPTPRVPNRSREAATARCTSRRTTAIASGASRAPGTWRSGPSPPDRIRPGSRRDRTARCGSPSTRAIASRA